jgi:hypothetical protein
MRVRPSFAFNMVLLSTAVCGLSLAAADEPAKTRSVDGGGIRLSIPETWVRKPIEQSRKARFNFRKADFTIPKVAGDKDDAEFVVFFFGDTGGGGVDPNVHRWVDQFESQDRQVKLTSGKCPQGDYVFVDIRGTWKKPIGQPSEGKSESVSNARVVSAVVKMKGGKHYYLRLLGGDKTVSANIDAMHAAIGADPKTEKEYKTSDEN